MLGVINLVFRDLDCVETSSNTRSELKLWKALMPGIDQMRICRNSLILLWVSRFESPKVLGIWLRTQGLISKELKLVIVVWILVALN